MPPHFETVKSFADIVITDAGVPTDDFLLAADGLADMFDLLGVGVFGFVQADLKANIAGVRAEYKSDVARADCGTLESLVRQAHARGVKYPYQCVVRLIRCMAFTCLALQIMQAEPQCTLPVCFRRSYDVVLRHHHTFVVRSAITLAILTVPTREHFVARLSQGGDVEKFHDELRRWLAGLDAIVQRTKTFLADGGYGKV
ncbi:glycolipid transfer protein domain-containing protein [Roridomyces roridus]|uniref:Glycolipid transfer protein domain-containing protein n=1 Tax=Roridomyces roridus TaxID=1738132 RepID=A0AAD7FKD4_9AGAR|nr:glycolipid transfer protein domain-containing protein [Roridomyces roridus]